MNLASDRSRLELCHLLGVRGSHARSECLVSQESDEVLSQELRPPGGTKRALVSWTRTSAAPRICVVTIGRPASIASAITVGKPSRYDGRTKTVRVLVRLSEFVTGEIAGHAHCRSEPVAHDRLTQGLALRSVADENERAVNPQTNESERLNEVEDTLLGQQATHEENDLLATGPGRARSRSLARRTSVRHRAHVGVADDPHVGARSELLPLATFLL